MVRLVTRVLDLAGRLGHERVDLDSRQPASHLDASSHSPECEAMGIATTYMCMLHTCVHIQAKVFTRQETLSVPFLPRGGVYM
jgi:hypothetical protein